MTKRRFWIAASLITLASIAMIAVAVSSLPTASAAWWTLLAAAAIGPSSLFWLWPRDRAKSMQEVIALRAKIASEQQQLTVTAGRV
jgi:hypothetical protein